MNYKDNPELKDIKIGEPIMIPMSVFSQHNEYLKLHETILRKEAELGCKYEKTVEHFPSQECVIKLTFI